MKFRGGANDSLKKEFDSRKAYKERAMSVFAPFALDTWYQFPNYGSLNREYEPVTVISQDSVSLFGDYAPPSRRALPFVVKAYNAFRETMLARTTDPNFNIPSYFGTLLPMKAYENFDELYASYIIKTKQAMSKGINVGNNRRALNYILENITTFPITQSGFLLSRHCPISTTGIAIELSELSHFTDSVKGDIINTPTFACFARDAKQHGFYIDKNNPWRLIANLDSEYMTSLIQEYKRGIDPEHTLTRFFRKKTHYEDINSVYNFFNRSLTIGELMEYTIEIRMAETGMDMSLKDKILKEAMEIYTLYSHNYPADPFKGSSAIIGKYCSARLKEVYQKKEALSSYAPTTLLDYS